tara:strand:- start:363 stop:965 length:603 start_codon:yes stop_codon:yes gene_type:complete
MEGKLDESSYKSAEIMITMSEKKKLNRTIIKFLKPFADENATVDSLNEDLECFKEGSVNEADLEKLRGQAKVCLHVCKSLDKMEPETLTQIQELAGTLHETLGGTGVADVGDLANSEILQNVMSTIGGCDLDDPSSILKAVLASSGNMDDELSQILNAVLPHIESAVSGGRSRSSQERSRSLLNDFSQIDGVVKTKKKER